MYRRRLGKGSLHHSATPERCYLATFLSLSRRHGQLEMLKTVSGSVFLRRAGFGSSFSNTWKTSLSFTLCKAFQKGSRKALYKDSRIRQPALGDSYFKSPSPGIYRSQSHPSFPAHRRKLNEKQKTLDPKLPQAYIIPPRLSRTTLPMWDLCGMAHCGVCRIQISDFVRSSVSMGKARHV